MSERQRLLAAHPYFELYKIAKRRFGVSWFLVASVHYQETGFGKARARLAHWRRFRLASRGLTRPERYPHRSANHPSVRDDFDVVMAIAAELKAAGATGLGPSATRATAAGYGTAASGQLSSAMVIERARAWRLLGTLPLPGRGELATPVKGIVGGCGYFGCPRPGHLHNGLDFLAPQGTPIHAADGGTVAVLESPGESGGYGNFVCLQHRPHLATCYAHLSAVASTVKPGAQIRRGQVVGLAGTTGSSTAPHLHFEVRRGDAQCQACAVDPLPLLDGDVPQAAVPEMVALRPTIALGPVTRSAPPLVAPAQPYAQPNLGQTGPKRTPAPAPMTPATGSSVRSHPAPAAAPAPSETRPFPRNAATGGTAPVTPAPSPQPPAPPAAPAPAAPPGPASPTAPAPTPQPPAHEPAPPLDSGGAPAPDRLLVSAGTTRAAMG
ncbi:MAG: hypothetical protein QOF69_2523 [Solirubrobacteraceae bacterium]|nr:hypothetical protein [Solirubrobacteraceae bacterium]